MLTDLAACLAAVPGLMSSAALAGDEFAVFLSSLSQASMPGSRPGKSWAAIAALLLEWRPDLQLSCSVGIALCPADGATTSACTSADLPSTRPRARERRACLLQPGAGGRSRPQRQEPLRRQPPSTPGLGVRRHRAACPVRLPMLYDAGTTEAATRARSEVVGRAYDVSRVYILKKQRTTPCAITPEWWRGLAGTENLQGLSYSGGPGDYQSNFDANGIFYCRDISTLHPDLYAVLA